MIVRVGDWKVFVWAVIDIETREYLGIWVSMAKHQFISKFIKNINIVRINQRLLSIDVLV